VPGLVLSILETYGEVLAAAHAWERQGIRPRRSEHLDRVPPGFHVSRTPWGWLMVRDGTDERLHETLLEATPEHVRGEPRAGGRGGVWTVAWNGTGRAVLRWYRRGGAVRHLLSERYFGWAPRPILELGLTEEARRRGIAAPEVLAARVDRLRGGWYRGAIVTREVPDALTLAAELRRDPADPERTAILTAVGRAVRRLHDRGVHHRDLNATNVLLRRDGDEWTVHFIDFDRADVRPSVGARARAAALRRLARSLAKLAPSAAADGARDVDVVRRAYDAADDGADRAAERA
jgi:tRNA A-37 threonylcarbamoyl transferase component Bud32